MAFHGFRVWHRYWMGVIAVAMGPVLASAGAALVDLPGIVVLRLPGAPVEVNGLAWYAEDAPVMRRLPARLKEGFRTEVWSLAQSPSGGRIRFRTDATRLVVEARNPDASMMHHMTSVGQNGLDLYVDGEYRDSAWPASDGRMVREWVLGTGRQAREVTIYLPLYKPVVVDRLVLDPGATVEAPAAFAVKRPVVIYGSSITQGGCAANTGLSYAAIMGRRLNVDFINLGFSGQGLGEAAMARAMAEIEASVYVLDFWANPTAEGYREALPGFVAELRTAHPRTPILVVGPFWFPAEASSDAVRVRQESKRAFARTWVEARRRTGDRRIYFVDGLELLGRHQASGLVDGVHPNSLGFQYCADGLTPHVARALGLRVPRHDDRR